MPSFRRLLLASLCLIAPAAARAQDRAVVPRVVDPAWLAANLSRADVVVLHVSMDDYDEGHIPGARAIAYDRIVTRRGTLGSELPEADSLRATFGSLGIDTGSTVVVYAHEAPMATRLLFSLASIGHARYAYLDGGLQRWQAEGRPVSKDVPAARNGRMAPLPGRSLVADAEYIRARLGRPGTAFIDTRTDGEYDGTGNRSGMPSAGHLEGARQLEWEQMFEADHVRLKPRAELEKLFAERTQPGDAVITYCWVGYRASATWFVAHWLGRDARLYDGSYQDWSQRSLPTTKGRTP